MLGLLALTGSALAIPQGVTSRVSLRNDALQGNGRSLWPSISADGRHVAFMSLASDLVTGDTNAIWDVFVRDRVTGEVRRVSVGSGGGQGNATSQHPAISADGLVIAFQSWASGLVPGDTNGTSDVFVHERLTGTTTRVNVGPAGAQSQSSSGGAAISGDGRHVAFESSASDLVLGDTNGTSDIFVHDRQTGLTSRVSVDSAGAQAIGDSTEASISADGRFVVFLSTAENLVPGDTNGVSDVFVHDVWTGATSRVSVDSAGFQANGDSGSCAISGDGLVVAFSCDASNLVPGDTNSATDVFVHERSSGQTRRVSIDSSGAQAGVGSYGPGLSSDGGRVSFVSAADDLVAGDTNGANDVFVHDLSSGATVRASSASGGSQGNAGSMEACMSADGELVVFSSLASNLVPLDLIPSDDVFLHDFASGQTTLESVCGTSMQASQESWRTQISADGRFVVFDSPSPDLVAGDTNGQWDVFLRDRWSGTTERVSLNSSGAQANGWSASARVSADGRYVAFDSQADNLVPSDTGAFLDVFVRDRSSGTTERVNVGPGGAQANHIQSFLWDISDDGRFVVFSSQASNLVAGDTNGREDVFVRDRQAGQTTRVSVSSTGVQGDLGSSYGSISADGRYVAFDSAATNLVPSDTNGAVDVFVRDRQLGETRRVSVPAGGWQGNGHSSLSRISADGRYVAFESLAFNLVMGDTNGLRDVFVHDRQMQLTQLVSGDPPGFAANGASERARISADGRFVAFKSAATNLVPGDTNNRADIFVRDRQSGEFRRVNVSTAGAQANGESYWPAISGDGRHVAFTSHANTLVPGDTNVVEDAFVHDFWPDAPGGFCFGDGTGAACPCGNQGATGRGCANSVDPNGAVLTATGMPSISADSLVLIGSGMTDSSCLYFQGSSAVAGGAGVPFGDGLRCAGGSTVRIGTRLNAGGASQYPLAGDPSVSVRGANSAGAFRVYQIWYRNAAAFCTPSTFNLTNGLALTWSP